MAIVPGLSAHLARESAFPLGSNSWGGTQLALPGRTPASWRNYVIGGVLHPQEAGDSKVLPVAEILLELPVALPAA